MKNKIFQLNNIYCMDFFYMTYRTGETNLWWKKKNLNYCLETTKTPQSCLCGGRDRDWLGEDNTVLYILTEPWVTKESAYTKTHRKVHLKFVYFILYKFYFKRRKKNCTSKKEWREKKVMENCKQILNSVSISWGVSRSMVMSQPALKHRKIG